MIFRLFSRTLYCAKNNYEFGISRVMKSLEPYQKKLGTDTWFYTKRCFLSLFENMARHSVIIRDQVLMEMLHFLSHCESKTFCLFSIDANLFRFRLGSRCQSKFCFTINKQTNACGEKYSCIWSTLFESIAFRFIKTRWLIFIVFVKWILFFLWEWKINLENMSFEQKILFISLKKHDWQSK